MEMVQQVDEPRRKKSLSLLPQVVNRSSRLSSVRSSAALEDAHATDRRATSSVVHITFSGKSGVTCVLHLRMAVEKVVAWVEGLQALQTTLPTFARPAHWRWALSCMAATNTRGAAGYLRKSEVGSLLLRANASPRLSIAELDKAVTSVVDLEQQVGLPPWLRALRANGRQRGSLLDVWQVLGLLLQLCMASREITTTFNRFAPDGRMSMGHWLHFFSSEQEGGHRPNGEADSLVDGAAMDPNPDDETTLTSARILFDQATASVEQHGNRNLDQTQFALLLLNPQNDALVPTQCSAATDDQEPASHYWTACSHNSWGDLNPCATDLVGDQLTGLSSADMYRRQLLQACRHVEVDCWNGLSDEPLVTHGHTFCTSMRFKEVAKAVADCAFVTSPQPVILSMEMHCTPKQQRPIAEHLLEHLDDKLLSFDEIVATGRAAWLSPHDLKLRCLVKGKIKQKRTPTSRGSTLSKLMSRSRRQSSMATTDPSSSVGGSGAWIATQTK
eukprot:4148756-Prymnesium_polylepis.1